MSRDGAVVDDDVVGKKSSLCSVRKHGRLVYEALNERGHKNTRREWRRKTNETDPLKLHKTGKTFSMMMIVLRRRRTRTELCDIVYFGCARKNVRKQRFCKTTLRAMSRPFNTSCSVLRGILSHLSVWHGRFRVPSHVKPLKELNGFVFEQTTDALVRFRGGGRTIVGRV